MGLTAAEANVRLLQTILSRQGYYLKKINGVFTKETRDAVVLWQQTHQDARGRWLAVDGIVGPATWWSLQNPALSTRKEGYDRVMAGAGLEHPDRLRLIKLLVAERAANVAEDPDGSNYGDGVTKYLKGVGPAYWCAFFLMWGHKESCGKYPYGKRVGLVKTIWEDALAHGDAFTPDNYFPCPGDEMVLLYRNSKGELTGTGHIELVVAAAPKKEAFNTVGGNVGNRVKICLRDTDQPSLMGFINRWGDHNNQPAYTRGLLEKVDLTAGDSTR
jgi:hypothetical protein